MDTPIQQLTDRVRNSLGTGDTARIQPWLWQPLLQLIALGEPVTDDQLADATGRSTGEIGQALAGMPDIEYDDDGAIVGAGLTLNPTEHRYETDGRTLYTWCALDTLMFPAVLGRAAQVSSPCHATGAPVRVSVEPDRVVSVEPATAVVSIVAPDAPASVRASFCDQVHFFAGADTAREWLDAHPGAAVVPVSDAYALGRPLAQQLLTGDTGPRCNC